MSMFRTLLMQKKGGLPPGVVLYDYLVGDGVAWIKTDIPFADNNLAVEGHLSTQNQRPYVTMYNGNTEYPLIRKNNGYYLGISNGATKTTQIYKSFGASTPHTMSWDLTDIYLDGASVRSEARTITNYVIGIGFGMTKIKSMLVTSQGGILVADLHPCTYNGVPGMWDMVGNQFYGNANTSGNFTVAND